MGREKGKNRVSTKKSKKKRYYMSALKPAADPKPNTGIDVRTTIVSSPKEAAKSPSPRSPMPHHLPKSGVKKVSRSRKRRLQQRSLKSLAERVERAIGEDGKFVTLYSMTKRPRRELNELDEFKFKKFRDNLKARNLCNSTALSILQSPQSKECNKLEQPQNISPAHKPSVSKREIILSQKKFPEEIHIATFIKKTEKPVPIHNISLEEGEIVTDDETLRNTEPADDDCIYVEPKVEHITIDENEDDDVLDHCEDISTTSFVDLTLTNDPNRQSKILNANEVIILDDTMDVKPRSSMDRNCTMDESVIFISETLPDYIPLVSDDVPKPLNTVPDSVQPIAQNIKKRVSLFSTSEKKELQAYNVNTYNPNATMQREQRQRNPKRMVIIDGSNVAFAHGRTQQFSVKGLQICIAYFQKMGHEVKAVIPLYRLNKTKSTDPVALQKMHQEGIIVTTPCKNLPGLCASSYDDRFILQLASELDAAIVSNDNYRDLIHENSAFKKLIENRVIGYTWCDDVFILPKDPYGKFGPTSHSILNRQTVANCS